MEFHGERQTDDTWQTFQRSGSELEITNDIPRRIIPYNSQRGRSTSEAKRHFIGIGAFVACVTCIGVNFSLLFVYIFRLSVRYRRSASRKEKKYRNNVLSLCFSFTEDSARAKNINDKFAVPSRLCVHTVSPPRAILRESYIPVHAGD